MAGDTIFGHIFMLAVLLLALVSFSTCTVLGASTPEAHNIVSLDIISTVEWHPGFDGHQGNNLVNRPATFEEAKCKGESLLNGIKAGNCECRATLDRNF